MSKAYQIADKKETRRIAEFMAANAQAVLPMVDLIEESMMAVDDLVERLGRATIEAVLLVSAANVAGERRQGVKSEREVGRHGSRGGVVRLGNRKMRVCRPRLRRRGSGHGGEVSVPAYEAMQSDSRLTGHLPAHLEETARCSLKAAWKLEPARESSQVQHHRESKLRREDADQEGN